jgi:hypothetical protein
MRRSSDTIMRLILIGFCLMLGSLILILPTFKQWAKRNNELYQKRDEPFFRQTYSLNKNWKQKTILDIRQDSNYDSFPPTECSKKIPSECSNEFDDAKWKTVRLPHDFVVEVEHNQSDQDKGHGYFPLGYSWYRKRFSNPDNQYKLWRLHFEGCMWLCHVYLNDDYLGNSTSG